MIARANIVWTKFIYYRELQYRLLLHERYVSRSCTMSDFFSLFVYSNLWILNDDDDDENDDYIMMSMTTMLKLMLMMMMKNELRSNGNGHGNGKIVKRDDCEMCKLFDKWISSFF